jgi:UDP-glucose 4-epimerase
VLELINYFEKINQIKLDYEIAPRRDGDVAICYADATRANNLLNWNAAKNISEMCQDAWDAAEKFKGV